MLDCCRPLDYIQTNGLTFDEWNCLAVCNGVKTRGIRASESSVEEFRKHIKEACVEGGEAPTKTSEEIKNRGETGLPPPSTQTTATLAKNDDGGINEAAPIMVVSYSRKGLMQSGDGHFSPIGGYCPSTDMCLVLDVARFKYPPQWVKVDKLFRAMLLHDKVTNKSRGFWLVRKSESKSQLLFRLKAVVISYSHMHRVVYHHAVAVAVAVVAQSFHVANSTKHYLLGRSWC